MEHIESLEMYLETIYRLRESGARAKSVDIAVELGFSRPSVSNAIKKMLNDGYVFVDKMGEIALTEKGQTKAQSVYERHCVLKELLIKVGADEKTAEDNACRVEHVISEEMFDILKKYYENNFWFKFLNP